jgi:hypothetical protein
MGKYPWIQRITCPGYTEYRPLCHPFSFTAKENALSRGAKMSEKEQITTIWLCVWHGGEGNLGWSSTAEREKTHFWLNFKGMPSQDFFVYSCRTLLHLLLCSKYSTRNNSRNKK